MGRVLEEAGIRAFDAEIELREEVEALSSLAACPLAVAAGPATAASFAAFARGAGALLAAPGAAAAQRGVAAQLLGDAGPGVVAALVAA
jgi:hypothetical protein